MRSQRGRRAVERTAAGLFCIVLTLGALACGVPIPQAELTATAEGGPGAASQAASSNVLADLIVQTPRPTQTPAPTEAPDGEAAPAETPTPAPESTVAAEPTPVPIDPAEVIALLNAYRTSRGLSALRVNPALTAAAQAYARLTAESNYWGSNPHIGPDGSTPQSRLVAAGYGGRYKGETMAAGQTSPQEVLDTWLNSPAHAAIVLDPTIVDAGIGYHYSADAYYGHYWVLDVGAP